MTNTNTPLLSITGTIHSIGDLGADALALVPPGSPGAVLRLADGRHIALWGLTTDEARALGEAFMTFPVEVFVSRPRPQQISAQTPQAPTATEIVAITEFAAHAQIGPTSAKPTDAELDRLGYESDSDGLKAVLELLDAVGDAKTNGNAFAAVCAFRKQERIAGAKAAIARWGAPATADALTEALEYAEGMLTNLQPHIPQACYPGRQKFIDNYVDPVLEKLRAALAAPQQGAGVPKNSRPPVKLQAEHKSAGGAGP